MERKLDFPFDEVAANAYRLVQAGGHIHQKWSCESCGLRQAMGEGDRFFTHGECEKCHHVTDLRKTGCNFVYIGSPDIIYGGKQ